MPSYARGGHCALRAPTLFLVRMKSASVPETRLWIKARAAWVCLFPRSSIMRGCAFHPCIIEGPRGRGAVRASARISPARPCSSVGAACYNSPDWKKLTVRLSRPAFLWEKLHECRTLVCTGVRRVRAALRRLVDQMDTGAADGQ